MEFILLYIALWLAFGFVFAMHRSGKRSLLIAPAVSLISLGLLVGKGPDVQACILLIAGLLPALAYTGDFTVWEETKLAVSILTGIFLIAGLSSYALWGEGIAARVFEKHDELLAYQRDLESDIRNLYINRPGGFSVFGGSNGSDGEITNRSPHFTGREIFRVTVDKKPWTKFYFRGYVGGSYENGRWSMVDEEDFSRKVSEWGYKGEDAGKAILNESFAHINAIIEEESFETVRSSAVSMEILYSDACGNFAYLPYYTQLYAEELESFWVQADAVLRRPGEVSHVPAYTAEVFADDCIREVSPLMDWQDAELLEEYAKDVRKTYTEVSDAGWNAFWRWRIAGRSRGMAWRSMILIMRFQLKRSRKNWQQERNTAKS